MVIKDLKEFKAFVKACRALGITDIKCNGIEFHLGQEPQQKIKVTRDKAVNSLLPQYIPDEQVEDKIATDSLTDEQLMFYSSGASEQAQ